MVLGPMPLTSSSASTVGNGPCSVRYAMIAAAVTGPTLGSDSSSVSVAVFTLTRPPAEAAPVRAPPGGGATGTTGAEPLDGTRICSPSASGDARFSRSRSALASGPPAACTASMIRWPGSNWNTPGCRTRPATCTNSTVGTGDAGGAAVDATNGEAPDGGAAAGGRAPPGPPPPPAPPLLSAAADAPTAPPPPRRPRPPPRVRPVRDD